MTDPVVEVIRELRDMAETVKSGGHSTRSGTASALLRLSNALVDFHTSEYPGGTVPDKVNPYMEFIP